MTCTIHAKNNSGELNSGEPFTETIKKQFHLPYDSTAPYAKVKHLFPRWMDSVQNGILSIWFLRKNCS